MGSFILTTKERLDSDLTDGHDDTMDCVHEPWQDDTTHDASLIIPYCLLYTIRVKMDDYQALQKQNTAKSDSWFFVRELWLVIQLFLLSLFH